MPTPPPLAPDRPADRRRDDRAAGRLDRPPRRIDRAAFPTDWSPVYMVFVDTEEEFDWTRPQARENTSTSHVPAIAEGQRRLADGGARPAYLVDWPITQDERAREVLGDLATTGKANVGLQLHPWVNPPFDEAMHGFNSFAGNLPPALEERKITRLRDEVAAGFGVRPVCYRAGRYGVGPNTAATLERLRIGLDVSVRAGFSYREQGGPDFRRHPARPYWAGPQRQLLEVPLGVGHLGLLGRRAPRALTGLREGRRRGLLARTGLLARVPLTPEGTTAREAVSAIDRLVAARTPVLSFSFHSPSLEPGHTPYVRDRTDLARFWRWWDAVFERLARHGVRGASVGEVLAAARAARAGGLACQPDDASATAPASGL